MYYYILISLFILFYSYLTCKNTKTGIYLIIFFLPSYLISFKIGPIPFTLLEGMILILFFCWLFKVYKIGGQLNLNIFQPSTNNPIPKTLRWPLILFLIAATLAAFLSENRLAALGIWRGYFIEPLLFFIVLIYSIKNLKEIKNIIYCLELLVLGIGIFALIQKITGALIPNPFWADVATRRVTTFFGYPNANGLLIAPIIILSLGNLITDLISAIRDSRFAIRDLVYAVFNLIILVLGILTIIFAQSAGALIAVFLGILFLLFYYKKTRYITLVAVIIFFILISLSSFSPFKQEINYKKLDLNSSSLEIRLNQWSETLKMLKDNPIMGAGLSNYQNKMKPYHQFSFVEIYLYPHNIILNFWSETGLLSLLALIWLVIIFFIYCFRKLKDSLSPVLSLTIIGAMITLLVHGLVDVPYFKNDLSILFWVIIGLIIINTKSQASNNK